MPNNSNLNNAKTNKDDEYYTSLTDIVAELRHPVYVNYLKGKRVLCNCNDGEDSNFTRYFRKMFKNLSLKQLVCVSYGEHAQAIVVTPENTRQFPLEGNGGYFSKEGIAFLNDCDIVITNPPFSHFRDVLSLTRAHFKDFILIGNVNAVACKDVFPLFKQGRLKFGYEPVTSFQRPNEEDGSVYARWYTNLPVSVPPAMPELKMSYAWNSSMYPIFDNYDAINVKNIKEIPNDYYGKIGVPISFLTCYDPAEFELIGVSNDLAQPVTLLDGTVKNKPGRFYQNGKRLYDRVVVQRKSKKRHTV